MKKPILILPAMLFFAFNLSFAQKIQQSQVPSLILNNFKKSFPKALDAEWEIKNGLYEVEFETGLSRTDHEILYNATGQQVKHEEEISRNQLPKPVLTKINSEFRGYRVSDVKKTTTGSTITYRAELEKKPEEWKVVFSPEGKIISKLAD